MFTKDHNAPRAGVNVNPHEILRRRLAQGMTQERLAREADLSLRTIQNLENGTRANAKTAQAVSRALGCTVADFTEELAA